MILIKYVEFVSRGKMSTFPLFTDTVKEACPNCGNKPFWNSSGTDGTFFCVKLDGNAREYLFRILKINLGSWGNFLVSLFSFFGSPWLEYCPKCGHLKVYLRKKE